MTNERRKNPPRKEAPKKLGKVEHKGVRRYLVLHVLVVGAKFPRKLAVQRQEESKESPEKETCVLLMRRAA